MCAFFNIESKPYIRIGLLFNAALYNHTAYLTDFIRTHPNINNEPAIGNKTFLEFVVSIGNPDSIQHVLNDPNIKPTPDCLKKLSENVTIELPGATQEKITKIRSILESRRHR